MSIATCNNASFKYQTSSRLAPRRETTSKDKTCKNEPKRRRGISSCERVTAYPQLSMHFRRHLCFLSCGQIFLVYYNLNLCKALPPKESICEESRQIKKNSREIPPGIVIVFYLNITITIYLFEIYMCNQWSLVCSLQLHCIIHISCVRSLTSSLHSSCGDSGLCGDC